MSVATEQAVRPFRVDVPDEALDDLRRRIAATRWPSRELVEDRSQGVQLATAAGARALLGKRLRLAQGRGEAQRLGAVVSDAMGRHAPEGLLGIHTNLLVAGLAVADQFSAESEHERAALDALATFRTSGSGYLIEQSTRPQTIGYALLDSPVALAAWMLDHDTDSYEKISRAFVAGQPTGHLTRDRIVDNIMLYWLTGTGASGVLGGRTSRSACRRPGPSRGVDPGRLHDVPRRDLRGAARARAASGWSGDARDAAASAHARARHERARPVARSQAPGRDAPARPAPRHRCGRSCTPAASAPSPSAASAISTCQPARSRRSGRE
jgi:Epoxide hydrolase N terminus